MASKNIEININNGSSYDTLYPKVSLDNVVNSLAMSNVSGNLDWSRIDNQPKITRLKTGQYTGDYTYVLKSTTMKVEVGFVPHVFWVYINPISQGWLKLNDLIFDKEGTPHIMFGTGGFLVNTTGTNYSNYITVGGQGCATTLSISVGETVSWYPYIEVETFPKKASELQQSVASSLICNMRMNYNWMAIRFAENF